MADIIVSGEYSNGNPAVELNAPGFNANRGRKKIDGVSRPAGNHVPKQPTLTASQRFHSNRAANPPRPSLRPGLTGPALTCFKYIITQRPNRQ